MPRTLTFSASLDGAGIVAVLLAVAVHAQRQVVAIDATVADDLLAGVEVQLVNNAATSVDLVEDVAQQRNVRGLRTLRYHAKLRSLAVVADWAPFGKRLAPLVQLV